MRKKATDLRNILFWIYYDQTSLAKSSVLTDVFASNVTTKKLFVLSIEPQIFRSEANSFPLCHEI